MKNKKHPRSLLQRHPINRPYIIFRNSIMMNPYSCTSTPWRKWIPKPTLVVQMAMMIITMQIITFIISTLYWSIHDMIGSNCKNISRNACMTLYDCKVTTTRKHLTIHPLRYRKSLPIDHFVYHCCVTLRIGYKVCHPAIPQFKYPIWPCGPWKYWENILK